MFHPLLWLRTPYTCAMHLQMINYATQQQLILKCMQLFRFYCMQWVIVTATRRRAYGTFSWTKTRPEGRINRITSYCNSRGLCAASELATPPVLHPLPVCFNMFSKKRFRDRTSCKTHSSLHSKYVQISCYTRNHGIKQCLLSEMNEYAIGTRSSLE